MVKPQQARLMGTLLRTRVIWLHWRIFNEDFCACMLYVFHFPSKASSLWLWLAQPGLSATVADLEAIRFYRLWNTRGLEYEKLFNICLQWQLLQRWVRTPNTEWKAVLILSVSHVAVWVQELSNGSIMSVLFDNSEGLKSSTSFDGLEWRCE